MTELEKAVEDILDDLYQAWNAWATEDIEDGDYEKWQWAKNEQATKAILALIQDEVRKASIRELKDLIKYTGGEPAALSYVTYRTKELSEGKE